MPEQSNDYRVVVFGAGGVGKSSLVLRFVKGTFRDAYIPTIEDTYRQVISCNKNVCTLQITDTTGSHQFPAMQRLSITKGHAFILVYSVTSRQSLEELKPIWEMILSIKGELKDVPIILVGNKCDENENRELTQVVNGGSLRGKCFVNIRDTQNIAGTFFGFSVKAQEFRSNRQDGEAMARRWVCNFIETSAKTNLNVNELFQELLTLEKNRNMSLQLDSKNTRSSKKVKEKCVMV